MSNAGKDKVGKNEALGGLVWKINLHTATFLVFNSRSLTFSSKISIWRYSVMVITLDFESNNPSSTLGSA